MSYSETIAVLKNIYVFLSVLKIPKKNS